MDISDRPLPEDPTLRAMFYVWTLYTAWICVSNLVVILVVVKLIRKQRKGVRAGQSLETNRVILHMSISDFCNGFLHFVCGSFARGDYSRIGTTGCAVFTFFLTTAGMSVSMVNLLGYVRYRLMFQREMTPQQVTKFITMAWIVSLFYGVFAALAGDPEPQPSGLYCLHLMGRGTWASTVLTIATFLFMTVPAFTLLAFYSRAFWNIRQEEAMIGGDKKYSPRVARVGVAVVLVYAITMLPYSIGVVFYRLVVPVDQALSKQSDAILTFFVLLNFGVNPFVYFIFQKDFANTARQFIPCLEYISSSFKNNAISSQDLAKSTRSSKEAISPTISPSSTMTPKEAKSRSVEIEIELQAINVPEITATPT